MARAQTLIANDQEWSARSIESVLAPRGHDVVRAFTGEQALSLVEEIQPHLIILDAQMPGRQGTEVCALMRQNPRIGFTTPIFITTSGPAGRKERLAAYRAGANEFFPEPLDLELFLARVDSALAASFAVRQLTAYAIKDAETGLYSPEGLEYRARQLQLEAARRQEPVSCVVIRAGEFDPGSALEPGPVEREALAHALRSTCRESDAVSELGPGQFAIVAAGVGRHGALSIVERCRSALHGLGALAHSLTAGVATLVPSSTATLVSIVPSARAALQSLSSIAREPGSTFDFVIR